MGGHRGGSLPKDYLQLAIRRIGREFHGFKELTGEGENSRLTFSHTVIKRFDTDDPLFSKENCQSGWEFFLNGQLPAFFQND